MRTDIAVDSANGETTVCRAVKEDSTGGWGDDHRA